MSDLISRQAVLDMLDDINNHIIDGYGYKHDWCVEWVKGLSSPVKHRGVGYTGIDDDYLISIKEVIDITAETGAMETQRRIKELIPIDAVPVVRCKDCKYARMTYDGECKYCDVWFPDEAEYLDGDYYCADAERKEE